MEMEGTSRFRRNASRIIRNPKLSEIANWTHELRDLTVQSTISDFGFEMQDSSNFRLFLDELCPSFEPSPWRFARSLSRRERDLWFTRTVAHAWDPHATRAVREQSLLQMRSTP